ncbi:MAG: 30S ribosomal protein S16 [Crocinitomicaceae bacterium]|nr:30S ribosomal protein S16 [Crocinitomicaceae bacterium]
MATKIRLQRHGKKRYPFYHIVIADERAKRDGRYIEKIGTYNPNTNPATIDISFERALHWVGIGAQPTDTARAILSYKGVMLKNHLDRGVAKGALTEADAEKKFEAWLKDKAAKIEGKADNVAKAKADEKAKAIAAEKEVNAAREAEIAAKAAPPVEEVAEEETAEAATEETAEAATEEAPAAEAETVEEAPAEEAKEEEAPAEEPKAEAEEAPAEEAKEEE